MLPGITAPYNPDEKLHRTFLNRSAFTGGVTDGQFAAAVMGFDNGIGFSGEKYIFCFDGGILFAGRDIKGPPNVGLRTTIDSRWSSGPAEITFAGGDGKILKDGLKNYTGVTSVSHGGLRYVFLKPESVTIQIQEKEAPWSRMYPSPKSEKGRVFTMYLNHGIQPNNAGYAWILTDSPAMGKPTLNITPEAVAAELGGIRYAVFRRAGTMTLKDGTRLSVSAPALWMHRKGTMFLTDPLQKRRHIISGSVNNKKFSQSMPTDDSAGISVRLNFEKEGNSK